MFYEEVFMARFQDLDRLLNRFAGNTVPGCACVIMKDGEPIYEGYAGYARYREQDPINEHSMFRQASTTKLFTYVICMMLFKQGEFLLNEPLYEYLPEWRDTKSSLSVRTVDRSRARLSGRHDPRRPDHVLRLPYCMRPLSEPSATRRS